MLLETEREIILFYENWGDDWAVRDTCFLQKGSLEKEFQEIFAIEEKKKTYLRFP
jgi:hypothetical protein